MSDIFGLVSQFLDPFILVLIVVTGYFAFFLFFYGTPHWGKLEWGDRVLIGFILGLMLFFFVSLVPGISNLWLTLMCSSSLPFALTSLVVAFGFMFLILILSFFRHDFNAPLHDSTVSEKWSKYFKKFKLMHLIEFYISWVFVVILVGFQYPLSEFLVNRWASFCVIMGIGTFVLYVLFPSLLSNITSMPDLNLEMFDNFKKDVKKVKLKSFLKAGIRLTMLFMLVFSITSLDSHFGLLTTKITLVESSNVINEEVILVRYGEDETITTSFNTITYHFIPPLTPNVGINYIQLRNPSNSTTTAARFEPEISYSDGINCYLSSDEEKLDIIISATNRRDHFVTMEYYDSLDVVDIVSIQETKDLPITALSNGTKVKEYRITLSNLSPYSIRVETFRLLELPHFHNVTSFEKNIEWEPESNDYVDINQNDSRFSFDGEIEAGMSLKIELKILYEET